MGCHCACLKDNEIKVMMTPGAISTQDIHLENVYLDGTDLVLEMNNGRTFRIDLSLVPGKQQDITISRDFDTGTKIMTFSVDDEDFDIYIPNGETEDIELVTVNNETFTTVNNENFILKEGE